MVIGQELDNLFKIIEIPCQHILGDSFHQRLMNIVQNDCLDDILDEFDTGSSWVRK